MDDFGDPVASDAAFAYYRADVDQLFGFDPDLLGSRQFVKASHAARFFRPAVQQHSAILYNPDPVQGLRDDLASSDSRQVLDESVRT